MGATSSVPPNGVRRGSVHRGERLQSRSVGQADEVVVDSSPPNETSTGPDENWISVTSYKTSGAVELRQVGKTIRAPVPKGSPTALVASGFGVTLNAVI